MGAEPLLGTSFDSRGIKKLLKRNNCTLFFYGKTYLLSSQRDQTHTALARKERKIKESTTILFCRDTLV
jgi:hypothetical protein